MAHSAIISTRRGSPLPGKATAPAHYHSFSWSHFLYLAFPASLCPPNNPETPPCPRESGEATSKWGLSC